ncbi:tetratricopeptide repeat protein [candidate division WS5 bacterium]|uniref:Tetratricopeptide repeat protein n=1 Tax=candidate division WS5 bacterium TaxID=2093353 RepID=A0A419DA75_9BACT|nr:MAG: tetratricopeptide repeat protein [candidate division WS5 bacterium]
MWEIIALLILAGVAYYFIKGINFKAMEDVPDKKEKKKEEPAKESIFIKDSADEAKEEDIDSDKIELIEEGLLEEEENEEKGTDRLVSDAHTELEKGNLREAEKLLIEAIKKDRKNHHAYFALGNIFFKEDNWEDAVNAFQKTVEYNPVNDSAFNNLGLAHFKQKDYAGAVSAFEKATAINPDEKGRFINLALAAKKNGDRKLAVKALERLTSLEAEPNLKHLKMLAEAYEANGQMDKSTKVLAQVLEIDPDDVDIKRKLARQK